MIRVMFRETRSSGNFMQIELFALDFKSYRYRLVKNDFGNNLLKSWQKFMTKLKEIIKKDFEFHYYLVDVDGKKHESEEYKKIQWKNEFLYSRDHTNRPANNNTLVRTTRGSRFLILEILFINEFSAVASFPFLPNCSSVISWEIIYEII